MKKLFKTILTLTLVWGFSLLTLGQTTSSTGTLQKWHKITVTLTLPGADLTETSTTSRNTRMDVVFTSPTGATLRVPGFFAADGNAANSSASQGKVFKAYLRPNEIGNWTYRVLYYTGTDVSLAAVASLPAPVYNLTGTVGNVVASTKAIPDLRAKGRLQYQTTGTNEQRRYLRFAETGEYFLKFGPDSPENMLDYNEFDFADTRNTCALCIQHTFAPHAGNYVAGDPTWGSGKGKNIIGVMNYLKSQQINSVSMSLFGGDDKNVFPWTNINSKFNYDVSKLEQWEVVFDQAEADGLMLHFKLAENENWNALDQATLNIQYREMVARFGHHLGLEWNISEEYGGTVASAIPRIDWLASIDPWNSPRVFHTFPTAAEYGKYQDLLNANAKITGASIQSQETNTWADVYAGAGGVLTLVNNSKNSSKPWVVCSDEQNPAASGVFNDANIATTAVRQEARTRILWKALIAGGGGLMWYGGSQGDFQTENFGRYSTLFGWSRNAIIGFFKGNNIEFWKMANSDNLVAAGANCLAEVGKAYVIYKEAGGSTNLNLAGQSGSFNVRWFDPRNGGTLQNGSVTTVNGGGSVSIGNPPNSATSDWVTLITSASTVNVAVTGISVTPTSASVAVGATTTLTPNVLPTNATNKAVTWTSSNTAIATVNASGVVTGVAAGTANITVTTNDGNFTATSAITVTAVASGQNPFGGTARAIPGTVESEDYDTGGQGVAYNDTEAANQGGTVYRATEGVDVGASVSQGGFVVGWTVANEWLEYTVNVATAGDYTLSFQYAALNTAGNIHVEFNGVNKTNTVSLPATGGWDTFQTVSRTVTLAAGVQVMRVFIESAGYNLNRLTFATIASNQNPFGGTARNIPGVVEIEDFDTGGQGIAYSDNEVANQGGQYRTTEGVDIGTSVSQGGFVVGWTVANEWLEYTVNVPTAGNYNMAIQYASLNTAGNIHVEFGGVNKTNTVSLPATGGWDTFQTVTRTVALSAGVQIMRVFVESAGYNLNRLTFTTGAPRLGVEEVSEQSILVYPNPVSGDEFTIEVGKYSEPASVKIVDIMGKPVYEIKTEESSLKLRKKVLPNSGVFIINVMGDDKLKSAKIVVE
jgi:Bacterial Ig-like domain (group 2)/Carbohydrate binding module (family 6)/Domain of unknown function (DUF5060)/Secretion system C-terminal sorting domain/Putative collagen-binding domain of a collagenase